MLELVVDTAGGDPYSRRLHVGERPPVVGARPAM
jgi:hypothetical protein